MGAATAAAGPSPSSARHLVDIALPFTVVRPDALRDALRDLARQLEETAGR